MLRRAGLRFRPFRSAGALASDLTLTRARPPRDYASATVASTYDVRVSTDDNDADFSMYFALLARPAELSGGVRPNARENSQIKPSTIVRARPNLASVLQEGGKSANIHVRSGAIWGIPVTKVSQHRVQGLPASSLVRSALARCQPYRPRTS